MASPNFTSTPVSGDKLELIRGKVREFRDVKREVADLEERLAERKKRLLTISESELVDTFDKNGVTELGLEPEGNLPGYRAEIKPYYSANIRADWDPARRAAGFKALVKAGGGYLVKTTYIIAFGKGEEVQARAFEKLLVGAKVSYSSSFGVHAQSLTAWLKEQVEKLKKVPPLEPIGGTVGRVVVIKEVKVK